MGHRAYPSKTAAILGHRKRMKAQPKVWQAKRVMPKPKVGRPKPYERPKK